jgi:thioredoxin reductase (NADPH)
MEEALALSKYVKKVKVVYRRDKLRATKILQERALDNPKIEFVWNSSVQEILGTTVVEGVRLKRTDTEEEVELACDAVFIAIGHKPNTDIFSDHIVLDEKGYIVVRDETKTSVEGVFAAGDVHDYRYRQAVTAAASGCKAALDVQKYLEVR